MAAIEPVLTPILSFLIGGITQLIGHVAKIAAAVVAAVASIVSVVSGAVSAIVNFFTVTIPNAANTVITFFKSLPGKIKSALGNLSTLLVSAGQSLIQGLVNGISNNASAVVNKIKSICSGALDTIKQFFGIASPSKLMAEMGGYIMQGLGVGIDNEEASLISQIKDTSANLSSAFNVTGTVSGNGANGAYNSVTIGDITINATDLNGVNNINDFVKMIQTSRNTYRVTGGAY